jgi:predicted Zn-dependent peptidase
MGRLTAVGFDWLYRHEYLPLERQIDELFAVEAEQVLAVARRYDLAAATLVALGPVEDL